MKRSEAYKRIRSDIKLSPKILEYARRFQDAEISWGRFTEILAEAALSSAEKNVGMLPPPCYDSFYPDELEDDGMIPEWEPEDE